MVESMGRRERKRERTRRTIADAAMVLFLEHGFDRVTVTDVAEAADVSVNTVFNHFPTKEELFFGSCEATEDDLGRLLELRKPGEPVIASFKRFLLEQVERFQQPQSGDASVEQRVAVRQILQGSQTLQVHALHRARQNATRIPDALAAAIAHDTGGRAGGSEPKDCGRFDRVGALDLDAGRGTPPPLGDERAGELRAARVGD